MTLKRMWSVARRLLGLAVVLLPLLVSSHARPIYAAGNPTANLALTLTSTYESISVYLDFDDDDNDNNQASFEYREVGGSFIDGMEMVVDRRDSVTIYKTVSDSTTYTNFYVDQWRASILGLTAGTEYEVQVTVTDADGVTGSSVVTDTIFTRTETALIPSTGGTFYVSDATGSDSTGVGSEGNPWKTIQFAVDNLTAGAGDTILVKAGTYSENVRVTTSGTSGNYITLRNYQTDTVTIKPPGDTDLRATTGISTDANFLRIKGFRIEGGNTGIRVGDDSRDVIVEDNFVIGYGNEGGGIEIGGEMFGDSFSPTTNAQNVTVQNNTVHVTVIQSLDRGGIVSVDNLGGHVIRNNTVKFLHAGASDHGEDCILHIENTDYDDAFKDTDIYDNTCIGATDDGIELDGNNVNLRVWGNFIENPNVGISIAPSVLGPTYIFRNVVRDLVDHWSPCIGIKEGRGGEGHVYFYHNTFFLRGAKCMGESFAYADAGGDPEGANVHIKNNVFYFAERYFSTESDPVVEADYNLLFDDDGGELGKYNGNSFQDVPELRSDQSFEQNGLEADPLFLDTVNDNFRLQPTSPAIDVGVVIQGFNDADSAWAFAGSAPDIGAFEFGAADATPPVRFDGAPTVLQPSATTQVDLTLVTDEIATCRYSGSPGTPYDSMPTTFTVVDFVYHSTTVTGLTSGTSNAYYIRCEDSSVNQNSDDFAISFDVSAPDPTPPIITSVQATTGVSTSTIQWTTDDVSDSTVMYSTTSGTLDQTATEGTLVTGHSLTLTGLSAGAVYFYQATSCNVDSVCSTSAEKSFSMPQQLDFNPTDDAFVREDTPDSSFGTAVTVRVDKADPTDEVWSFFRFDVSGVTGDVLEALLTIHVPDKDKADSAEGGELFRAQSTGWTESTLTWNNKPALDASPLLELGPVVKGFTYQVDVTPAVTGDGPVALAIKPTSGNGAEYESRESARPPVLSVTYQPVAAGDTGPPIRSNGLPTGTLPFGTTQTTMSLETNEQAICHYADTMDTSFGAMPGIFVNTSSTVHTTTLSGLTGGSSHTKYVRCIDSVGNENDDDFAISFSVASSEPAPPLISDVVVHVGLTTSTVEWTTDAASDSLVMYSTTDSSLDQQVSDAALVTSHSIGLTGLLAGTEYFYRAKSCVAALCSTTNIDSFTTMEQTQFPPTDDATVRAAEPDTSFGTTGVLEIDKTPLMVSYLKFEVTGTSGEISSATVNLFNADTSVEGGAISLVPSSSWDESTVTWNSRPATSTDPALDTLGAVAVDTWYALDVTSAVTGDGTYTFVIQPTHTNGADYDAKEGTNPPYLELTYGTTTVSGPTAIPGLTSWGLIAMAATIVFMVLWMRRTGHRFRGER